MTTAPDDLEATLAEFRLEVIRECQQRLREMGVQLGLSAQASGGLIATIGERMGRNFHDAAEALETLKR